VSCDRFGARLSRAEPAPISILEGSTSTSAYALNRLIARGTTTYTYNGDGALVYDGATRYTQDLAAPLSQVLQTTQGVTTTDYLYGANRLASVAGSTRSWYLGDALGSVRQTFPVSLATIERWRALRTTRGDLIALSPPGRTPTITPDPHSALLGS
jgi:hypothetical protein